MSDAMALEADRNPVHPVRAYLESLTWDGTPRVRFMLRDLFHCVDTPDGLTQAMSLRWMVAAVARVMQPGCKVDEMLIIQSPRQGIGKSSGLAALAPEREWFSDTRIDLRNKDAYQALHGVWIYEWGELDSLKRAEATAVKSFLSEAVDRYRPPYGREMVTQPRQCVIAGTTNEDAFLYDATGNRRHWVRQIREDRVVDVDGIRRDRDQLWAEAAELYRRGEQWHLTSDEQAAQAADVEQYVHADPWMDKIEEVVLRTGGVLTLEQVFDALDIAEKDRHRGHQMRASGVLQQLGLRKVRKRVGGRRMYVWER